MRFSTTPTATARDKVLQFPPHTQPRVWLITSITTPIGISTARHALSHGDSVVAAVRDADGVKGDAEVGGAYERSEAFSAFWDEVNERREWNDRCKRVPLDGRIVGQCQSAVAQAVEAFGRLDILFCCDSEALIGTVEELAATPRTHTLVREQFETNFFEPVNIIKAALPEMRRKNCGHIMVLTGITGHLGTPGLGMYCASGWALEGFCDSLAYEIAPFNIKLTIIQPTIEIGILTNKIVSVPSLPQYAPEANPAPLFRGIIGSLLDRIQEPHQNGSHTDSSFALNKLMSLYPKLPQEMTTSLLAETVNAIMAIGGHDNPPARHIVGHEGVASVKEKLKTVSEELEDFVEVSCAVDIDQDAEGHDGMNGNAVE